MLPHNREGRCSMPHGTGCALSAESRLAGVHSAALPRRDTEGNLYRSWTSRTSSPNALHREDCRNHHGILERPWEQGEGEDHPLVGLQCGELRRLQTLRSEPLPFLVLREWCFAFSMISGVGRKKGNLFQSFPHSCLLRNREMYFSLSEEAWHVRDSMKASTTFETEEGDFFPSFPHSCLLRNREMYFSLSEEAWHVRDSMKASTTFETEEGGFLCSRFGLWLCLFEEMWRRVLCVGSANRQWVLEGRNWLWEWRVCERKKRGEILLESGSDV